MEVLSAKVVRGDKPAAIVALTEAEEGLLDEGKVVHQGEDSWRIVRLKPSSYPHHIGMYLEALTDRAVPLPGVISL